MCMNLWYKPSSWQALWISSSLLIQICYYKGLYHSDINVSKFKAYPRFPDASVRCGGARSLTVFAQISHGHSWRGRVRVGPFKQDRLAWAGSHRSYQKCPSASALLCHMLNQTNIHLLGQMATSPRIPQSERSCQTTHRLLQLLCGFRYQKHRKSQ